MHLSHNDTLWPIGVPGGCFSTGISEADSHETAIYPNPTSGSFSIVLRGGSSEVDLVQLYRAQGVKVPIGVNADRSPVELSLPMDACAGVYLLQVLFDDGSSTFTKVSFQP